MLWAAEATHWPSLSKDPLFLVSQKIHSFLCAKQVEPRSALGIASSHCGSGEWPLSHWAWWFRAHLPLCLWGPCTGPLSGLAGRLPCCL